MNKEFNGFDEMVEALEENEDMVECKECFDLVPKVDCERAEVGYICPTCKGLRTAPARAKFVDPYDSYTQDFPEVTEYDPDSVVEYEKEPGLGDALSDLIRDEYEAIDGYEVADETVQHADIDEDEKDEILDTLDHIKEEEEEHIDELKELCPECDPVAEPEIEPEKLEEAADDEVVDEEAEEIPEEESSEEEAEDFEENENEEVSDLETAYEAALEIANESGVGQVFGYAKKDTEEFVAIDPFEVDDPEAVEDDLMAAYDDVAYAYVAYPEKELEESLFEGVQLNEVTGKIQRGWDALKNKARAGVRNVTKAALNINDIFSKGYYVHIDNVPEDDMVDAQGNSLQDRTTDNLKDAERLAINISKRLPKAQVYLMGEDEGVEIEDRELKKLVVNKYAWKLARYRAGSVNNSAIEAINKRIKELELAGDNIDATSVGTRSSSLDRAKKAAKETLGTKLDPTEYTPESYRAYSAYFDSIVSDISNARTIEDLEKLGVETLKKDAEKLLKKKAGGSTDLEDDDLNLDDDEDALEAAKAKAKEALGEKQDPEKFTEESYKKYEDNYNRIIDFIDKRTKVEDIEKLDIEALRAKLSKYLRLKPADETPDLDDEDESGDELENAKKAALEAMGEKKKSDAYTEDSYAAYSKKFDNAINFINKQTDAEIFKKYNFEQLRARYEALLREKEADDIPDEEDDIPEEPVGEDAGDDTDAEDTEDGNEEEEPAEGTTGKLSEVSEEQLKKLFTAVTGRGVGDNKKWQKVLTRMRAKLQELGESLDPQDYKAEDFIEEELQSEAEAIKSLKDTQATLKSAADGIKNMTSAMKESILNLSPEDFAECVDSSRVELWGLEESEDGVAHAVLIKSYDDVSDEDIQSCHDKMIDLDGMFTFSFTASGKPSVYGWNAEQLRELIQAGVKGISFDNPAYEEALSLAWRIK